MYIFVRGSGVSRANIFAIDASEQQGNVKYVTVPYTIMYYKVYSGTEQTQLSLYPFLLKKFSQF